MGVCGGFAVDTGCGHRVMRRGLMCAWCWYGSSSLFIRVAIHNIELLYNAGAVVIRVAIHITYVKRIKGHFYE